MTRNRSAFSLIELMVALAILAAVTTIALRSVNGLQNQARYQATQRSLDEVRSAILGPANERNPDGTPLVTGFVADTGRSAAVSDCVRHLRRPARAQVAIR